VQIAPRSNEPHAPVWRGVGVFDGDVVRLQGGLEQREVFSCGGDACFKRHRSDLQSLASRINDNPQPAWVVETIHERGKPRLLFVVLGIHLTPYDWQSTCPIFRWQTTESKMRQSCLIEMWQSCLIEMWQSCLIEMRRSCLIEMRQSCLKEGHAHRQKVTSPIGTQDPSAHMSHRHKNTRQIQNLAGK